MANERLRGSGKLFDSAGNPAAGVTYDIEIRQDRMKATTASGPSDVPGFKTVERATMQVVSGRIDPWNHREPYKLELEDGSTVSIAVVPEHPLDHGRQVFTFTFRDSIIPPAT